MTVLFYELMEFSSLWLIELSNYTTLTETNKLLCPRILTVTCTQDDFQ